MRKRIVSMNNVVEFWKTLKDEEKLAFADNSELMKRFLARLARGAARNSYVVALSDDEAVKLLVESKKYTEDEAKVIVASWRKYAAARGYTGPVAWKIREGFMLKKHAPLAGPCYDKLGYLQSWKLRDDESTKDSIVFWVPRLAEGSTSKTIFQMETLRMELLHQYGLSTGQTISFGSISLLFALILAHFKRTGERVPLQYLSVVSDSFVSSGRRLIAGIFNEDGLGCIYWSEDNARDSVGFFLLGVEQLGV